MSISADENDSENLRWVLKKINFENAEKREYILGLLAARHLKSGAQYQLIAHSTDKAGSNKQEHIQDMAVNITTWQSMSLQHQAGHVTYS